MRPLPPGPRGVPLLGVVPALIRRGADYFVEAFRRHGDVVQLRLVGPMRMILFAEPEHVHHVLVANARNYAVKRPSLHLSAMMGSGLTLSNGELWQRQRRLMQPAFHRRHADDLAAITVETIAGSLDRWRPLEGAVIDVTREMERLSFAVLLATLFGSSLDPEEVEGITEAVELVLRAAGRGLFLEVPPAIPTPENLRIRRSLRALKSTIQRLIAAQRGRPPGRENLLTLLLAARDEETGAAMSEQQLHDELISIFVAGYETTAVAIAWALLMIARRPALEARLVRELRDALGERTPAVDDLPRLGLLDRVIRESMRIYPPFWAMTREVVDDDEVGGYRIPAGALAVVSPYVTHRHPAHWPAPERFDPDRFLASESGARHRLAYLPFGAGPRVCIGTRSGLLTTQLALAMILQRYHLEPADEHLPRIHAAMTLRPKEGIRARLVRRDRGR